MQPFESLTSRGQARRLRTLAFAALAQYDLPVRAVRLISYHFNAIFRVDTGDRRRFVLRINIPGIRSPGNILAEMEWLAALTRDTDLVVPEPLRNRAGELVTTVGAAGVPELRHCVVFGWVPGRDLHHAITPENYRKLGMFSARLHDHAESWTPTVRLELGAYDRVLLFETKTLVWESLGEDEGMPAGRIRVFRQAYRKANRMLSDLYASSGPLSILHADLHQGNLRLFRGGMHALDFDDCLLGYFVQDVGITFYYAQGHPDYPELQNAYRTGYESVRPWPETAPGQVAGMVAARGLLLSQFLFDGANPAFRAMLPSFLERAEVRLRAYLGSD